MPSRTSIAREEKSVSGFKASRNRLTLLSQGLVQLVRLPRWLGGKVCLPVQETQESWVRSLGQGEPLEEEIGNPLQYSCLENPMDGGAGWAVVHGVTKR